MEVTMVTTATATATANPKVITNNKMAPNQHAGGATSMVTVKKIAVSGSKLKLHARGSTVQPIGQSKNNPQWEKMKIKKKFKEQLVVNYIRANLQVCSRVFNEGRSYFPDLRPKNIFFNNHDVVFNAFAENKFIYKENYVLQWGNLQNNLQPRLHFPVPIHTQHHVNSAIPMDKCYKKNSLTFGKNFEHYHRWKTALCQGQSEWLWKKLFIRHRCIKNMYDFKHIQKCLSKWYTKKIKN
jgi:hypothetical protein